MRHFLVTFVASLVLTSAAHAADGKKLSIRWHGQSFFEIKTSAGTRIVLDPHAIEAYGRHDVEADLILISHLHNDHTQVGVITNFKPANLRLGLKEPKGDVTVSQDGQPLLTTPVDLDTFEEIVGMPGWEQVEEEFGG